MTFGLLIAEVNEKEILLKEASRFSLRRQYEKAIFIYKDLEQKFPDDYEISEKLIENYFFTSRIDEAEKLLEDKRVIFPEINYVKLKTSVLLIQSKVKEAEKLSGNYLSKNSRKINNYKLFASIFQRYRQY